MSNLAAALSLGGSTLDSFGQSLVARFSALNVLTAALLGGALVLDRALARRARASWRIALYAPVALRILVPLDWSVHLARAPRVVALLAPLRIASAAAASSPSRALSWHALVACVYVAVAVVLAARAVVARVRLGRALVGAPAVPISSHLAGETRSPVVVQHDHLGPMAIGLFAPRIVLPTRLLAVGDENALACVLRHEVAHVRRGDAWLSVTMQFLAIVAWPVAPLWIAMARVRQLMELACDESALAGANAGERRRYGHALLDVAEWSFSVAPLGAGELHFGSTLRARIEALASQRHWSTRVQALALSGASVALLAACTVAPASPTTAPTGTTSAAVESDKDYGYQFETDSAKAAAAAPGASSAPEQNGRLPPETIQATVRASFGLFRQCYEAGLAKNATLAGTVTVKYTIAEDGSTTEATDDASTLPDKDVVACVVGGFQTLHYTRPEGGIVTVVYPIQLAP